MPAGNRRRAGVWLAAYGLAVAVGVFLTRSGDSAGSFGRAPSAGRGDIRLHWDVVARLRAGEAYYPAMHAELQRHGYPTASVFNWRAPPALWLAARLPVSLACWIISAGAVWLVVLTFQVLRAESGVVSACAGGWLVLGAVLPCLAADVSILPLLWGAVCVGLSLCQSAQGRTGCAIVLGTAAACFRELAAGHLLVMACLALWHGRRREAAKWAAGGAAFATFYAWHAAMVSRMVGAEGLAQAGAWLQFGGLRFVLSTAQMNCWLLPLPAWVTAIYLPTALVGLATGRTSLSQGGAWLVTLYGGLFLFVGQPFNQYWGFLLATPLAWGAARGGGVLGDLAREFWTGTQASSLIAAQRGSRIRANLDVIEPFTNRILTNSATVDRAAQRRGTASPGPSLPHSSAESLHTAIMD